MDRLVELGWIKKNDARLVKALKMAVLANDVDVIVMVVGSLHMQALKAELDRSDVTNVFFHVDSPALGSVMPMMDALIRDCVTDCSKSVTRKGELCLSGEPYNEASCLTLPHDLAEDMKRRDEFADTVSVLPAIKINKVPRDITQFFLPASTIAVLNKPDKKASLTVEL